MESLYAAGALILLIFLGIIIRNVLTGKTDTDALPPDPLAEAEVYLAYGRHNKAVEILERALETDSTREDIRQKLNQLKKR